MITKVLPPTQACSLQQHAAFNNTLHTMHQYQQCNQLWCISLRFYGGLYETGTCDLQTLWNIEKINTNTSQSLGPLTERRGEEFDSASKMEGDSLAIVLKMTLVSNTLQRIPSMHWTHEEPTICSATNGGNIPISTQSHQQLNAFNIKTVCKWDSMSLHHSICGLQQTSSNKVAVRLQFAENKLFNDGHDQQRSPSPKRRTSTSLKRVKTQIQWSQSQCREGNHAISVVVII